MISLANLSLSRMTNDSPSSDLELKASKQASKRANEQNEQSKWYTAKHEDKLTHQDDISGSHVDIIVNAFCEYGVVRYKFGFFGEV
jgi:hypothetical protein